MLKRPSAAAFYVMLCFALTTYSQSISKTNFSGVVGSGARAFGMGGAFIAVADDATAASWNPGGLGQLENPEFSLVIKNHNYSNLFPARSSWDNFFVGPQDFNGSSFIFDFASATFPFRIGDFKIVPQVSYQRAVNFDVSSKLNNVIYRSKSIDSTGKRTTEFNGIFTYEDDFSGGFDAVSFSLGTKLFKGFNIGFSVNFWMNGSSGKKEFSMNGTTSISDSPVTNSIEVSTTTEKSFDINGINFNVGVLIEIMENLKVGGVYKSPFDATLEYDNLSRGQAMTPQYTSLPSREVQYSGKTTLEWPETWGAGLSFAPIDQITLSADYTRTNWSQCILRNFNNAETDEREIDVYFPTMKTVTSPDQQRQVDTEQIRFGMEYVYIEKEILIPFRLGFFTDTQYFKDASGEKITFIGLTAGIGFKWGPLALDLAMMYESGSYLETNISYSAADFSELKIYLSSIFSF